MQRQITLSVLFDNLPKQAVFQKDLLTVLRISFRGTFKI